MTVTTFSELELDESLLESLQDKGFTRPTAIQAAAIPPALDGRDVLGSAPTGTGKTAGDLVPALQHLLDFPRKKSGPPRILILTPTRELAMQVADHARELAKHTHLDIATITGGVAYMNHAEVFSENQDIVVATTGRLLQYIKEENFDCRAVETLILDEADRMLDMGFLPDLKRILKALPPDRQTLLFSATFSPEIKKLASEFLNKPESVEIERNKDSSLVRQTLYRVPKANKHTVLRDLIVDNQWDQVLVFTRTKYGADKLVRHLLKDGLVAKAIHGDKSQSARTTALREFKEHKLPILVATDIAARGLDIEKLPQVVNYELPQQAEDYVHRIGRTGRAGEAGEAYSLVSPEELPQLAAIEKFIKKPLPLSDFPRLDYSDWKVSAPTKPQNKNRRPGPRRNGPAGFKRSDGKPSVRRRTARGQ